MINARTKTFLDRLVRRAAAVFLLCLAFGVGYVIKQPGPMPGDEVSMGTEVTTWTCAMHPQIRQPKPGKCPICAMDLVPVENFGAGDTGPSSAFVTSEAVRALMNIRTAPVERRYVDTEIRMSGKVVYDETRLSYITAWVPGRLDRLYVDFTGVEVKKGDHMVSLYSPELLTAQDELVRAKKALAGIRPGAPETLRATAESALGAARLKLRRYGLTAVQIEKVERDGVTSDHVTIYAPAGGTVVERKGQEGAYVDTGNQIYAIADLTQLWVKLDAYESDLPWLHYGQEVVFTTEAHPGREFAGRIAFIDPILDLRSRTVKVRVNVPNESGDLKPGMFVRAVVRAQVATDGRVMNPDLAGKWVSPMHPEIVKDGPGVCDVCGMALVTAESLGYVSSPGASETMPLVIPATAPLLTGKRAVVYVEDLDAERPTYVGREITLGQRAGDYYIVRAGLREGERVVVNGNFKIDSALQIQARPSMMSPVERDVAAVISESLRRAYFETVDVYSTIHEALAVDALIDDSAAREAAAALRDAAAGASGDAVGLFDAITTGLEAIAGKSELSGQREAFEALAGSITEAVDLFGAPAGAAMNVIRCPLAFEGRGALWLQTGSDVRNPYFGSAMPDCGTLQRAVTDEHGHAPHGERE